MSSEQTFEDKLAIQLMECAILVKKGERNNPLVLETLEKLRDFCFPDAPKERSPSTATTNHVNAKHQPQQAHSNQHHHHQNHAGGPVMKPFGVLGKMIGISGDDHHHAKKTPEQKAATSQKNAARLKEEIAADGEHSLNQSGGSSWLPFGLNGNTSASNTTEEGKSTPAATPAPAPKGRPEFQRPSNAKSALIANGWIEQQRRSRMRPVWKDVLASLVEGRKSGEETTLWIQRQITNSSGVAELEALHQIPVKWIQEVTFIDYSTDNRFCLRVYNLNEDFVFRCPKDPAAAENWVVTLRSAKEAALKKREYVRPPPADRQHHDEKKSADRPRSRPTSPTETPATKPVNPPGPAPQPTAPPAPQPAPPPVAARVTPEPQPENTGKKTSIKELRALAHGAGISTIGMERGELERIVTALTQSQAGAPPPPPTAAAKVPEPESDLAEERRRKEALAEAERRRRLAEAREREAAEEEAKAAADEAERKRQEEEHQRLMAERVRSRSEALRKQKEEEERQRLARERQIREEDEMRRRMAQQQAEQQRRQQEENARREQEEYRRRQEAWQQQQAAEEERRRMAEQQEAERRRQQEEAYRRHMAAQQWHHQQAPHAAPSSWQPHQPQQTPFGFPGYQQQHHQQHPPPPAENKYAKMAAQKDDNTSTQHIKHAILIHWALQPPTRQGLRKIEDLITSIHTVFPPAFGVPGHEYFSKWTPIVISDISDDDKLEKKVKKLRFFLHPDKLPKDLTTDQSFMVRMLWDITSDALEEHKKQKEDLNWIHQ